LLAKGGQGRLRLQRLILGQLGCQIDRATVQTAQCTQAAAQAAAQLLQHRQRIGSGYLGHAVTGRSQQSDGCQQKGHEKTSNS
jgi:hypothetical protein